jgi:hypothetical protein
MSQILRPSRAQIERTISDGTVPEHLVPLHDAVSPEPFVVTGGRPHIVLIGDDLPRAKGPATFHLPSLVRVFRRANGIVVVSSEARPEVYALAAQTAVLVAAISTARARLLNVTLLVETALEREIAWGGLARKHAPGVPLLLSTVKRRDGMTAPDTSLAAAGQLAVIEADALDDGAWVADRPDRAFRARTGKGRTWFVRRRQAGDPDAYLRTFAALLTPQTDADGEIAVAWYAGDFPDWSGEKARKWARRAFRRGG